MIPLGIISSQKKEVPPGDKVYLTIDIGGSTDPFTLTVDGVAQTGSGNVFEYDVDTLLEDIVVSIPGYNISPSSVDSLLMDSDKTLYFTAMSTDTLVPYKEWDLDAVIDLVGDNGNSILFARNYEGVAVSLFYAQAGVPFEFRFGSLPTITSAGNEVWLTADSEGDDRRYYLGNYLSSSSGFSVYFTTASGDEDGVGLGITTDVLMRFRGNGTTIYREYSTNNGSSWTEVASGYRINHNINYYFCIPFGNNSAKIGTRVNNIMQKGLAIASKPIMPKPNYYTLSTAENYAENIYYAPSALTSSMQTPQENDSVGIIQDLKGGKPLWYSGTLTPVLVGRPPIFSRKGLGTISFDNEFDVAFLNDNLRDISAPYEFSLTMISQPGTEYESWLGQDPMYIANNGSTLRVVSSGNNVSGSNLPAKYYISNLHFIVRSTGAQVWLNGISQGTVSYSGQSTTRHHNIIGTSSHNAQWEFIALHCFNRELTTTERNLVFTEFADKFNWGQEKQLPYASNIVVTKSGTNVTATYTYRNPLGIPQDTGNVVVRWVGVDMIAGGLDEPDIIDGQGLTIPISSFRSSVNDVKCEIQVFDTAGNTWKRLASPWLSGIR